MLRADACPLQRLRTSSGQSVNLLCEQKGDNVPPFRRLGSLDAEAVNNAPSNIVVPYVERIGSSNFVAPNVNVVEVKCKAVGKFSDELNASTRHS